MTDSLATALERVAVDLTSNGVDLPRQWLESIRTALEHHRLDLLTPDMPDEIIEAHFAFMNAHLDDVTTIAFSQAMADVFTANARVMKPAFARAGKNQFMTRIVLTRRLASRYFHEGRRRVDEAATVESGVWLLQRGLRLGLDVVDRDDRATPNVRRMMHSQIATSSAHIARSMARDDEEREALIRDGLDHSLAAEKNGDRTPDHDGYAIELALRLHELTGEDSLSQVTDALARARDADSATLQGLVGDVEFAWAAVGLTDHAIERAVPHILAAVDHYDRAIALPRDRRSADIGYHLAKRGRCYALLYEHGADAAGRRDTAQLDRALADWLDLRTRPHRSDHETARLLLARARLAAARSDTTAAGTDLAEAARLLTGQHRPREVLKLEGQTLGAIIEEALDNADFEAVTKALSAAAALSPEAPAPAGSMAKAAMWLHGRLPLLDWEQVAEPVLDRIEVDVAHPALTASARGHVTGHAASLARALYLTDDVKEIKVLRAVELSRAHIDSAQILSAAALDGASRAAFKYARVRASADEAASEDELGNWTDALLWGVSALQTEHTIRTTVESRFDIAACAVRVADSALKLLESTGDFAFVETAADGVAIASDLAPDAHIEAARAKLAVALNPTTPRSAGRRVLRPAGPPRDTADKVSVASERLHIAWRTLADADRLTGEAAQALRQKAAIHFCELADDGDPNLGGKQRAGRRGVTSVNDPYGIARQLVVLKRVDRVTAQREFDAITRLRAWLSRADKPRGWSAPEPIGVVDIDAEDAVFVMRRLPGHTLAHHAMEHLDGRAPSPHRMFEAAVRALGDFHTAMENSATAHPEDVSELFRRAARQLTQIDAADTSTRELAPLLNSGTPLAKKDAHAGNWLWSTAAGGLIVIDVEGKTTRPVILELATLIDDLPLFDLDANGWDQRVEIAKGYVSSLPTQVRIGDQELRHLLEAGALNVAVLGLARLQRRSWGTSSRGIRFVQYQHRHYQELMAYLARAATSNSVRRSAAALRASA